MIIDRKEIQSEREKQRIDWKNSTETNPCSKLKFQIDYYVKSCVFKLQQKCSNYSLATKVSIN